MYSRRFIGISKNAFRENRNATLKWKRNGAILTTHRTVRFEWVVKVQRF